MGGSVTMGGLVHSAKVTCAVTQVASEADSRRREALGYPVQRSVCSLTARLYIIARGFAKSREAKLIAKFNRWKPWSVAHAAIQLALMSAVLALYSKNIVSSAARTLLGI